MPDPSTDVFVGLTDVEVILIALLFQSGAKVQGANEDALPAAAMNAMLEGLIDQELEARQINPASIAQALMARVLERLAQLM